jgi:hypothetical protein
MAISRPLLLALLGAVLLGVTFVAVQNARDGSSADVVPVAPQTDPAEQAAPAEPAPAASPKELLKSAFEGGSIDSTAFTAEVSANLQGERGSLDISGAFQQGAANDVPEFEVSVDLSAGGQRVAGGLTSLGDEAYFTKGDSGWRVPDEVWNPVVEAAAAGAAAQPQNLALPVDPQRWVRDAKSEGSETIDGVETTHVSATLDPNRVVGDLLGAVRAGGQRVPGAGQAARSVESAGFDAWIGTDDRVMRRLEVDVAFTGSDELSLDIELTGVNQPQDIEAPPDVRTGMPDGAFGQFAQGLAAGVSGLPGGSSVPLEALTSPNPRKAARAVTQGRKVVILFYNPDGLDDRAMRRVVRQVDARTKAVVLSDNVAAVDRYGNLVEDLGVSQTPAVVLIDSRGNARLVEGFVDSQTLTQAVADAR